MFMIFFYSFYWLNLNLDQSSPLILGYTGFIYTTKKKTRATHDISKTDYNKSNDKNLKTFS